MKKLSLMTAAIAIGVTGCVTPTEKNRFQLEVSKQICNVDALAEEKSTTLAVTNSSRYSIAAYQNKSGTYEEQTDTILLEKLNRYDAELEASYRFVTQQCGAYMRCIESNGHDEWSCKRSETRWNDAQDRFNELSLEIRDIVASVEKARIRTQRGKKRGHDHRGNHGDSRECCSTINSIFTDCCG